MSMNKDESEQDESVTNLRKMILSKLESEEIDVRRQKYSVMTRLSEEFIELLDALVKLDIFKSRSEAVAAIVMKSILSEYELYQQLKEQADKLGELQDTVKGLALKALRD